MNNYKHFHALRNERSGWNAKRAAAERWALPRHNLARADPIELVRRDETGFIQSECRMIGRRPNRDVFPRKNECAVDMVDGG